MRLRMLTPTARTAEVFHALRLLAGPIQVQPGYVESQLLQVPDNENMIHYSETWLTWECVEKQIRSDRFGRILELMEISVEPPLLIFHDLQETRGIEYVERIRGKCEME